MEKKFTTGYSKDYQIYIPELDVQGIFARLHKALKFVSGSNQKIYFERDNDNEHDKNAIKVIGISKHFLGLFTSVNHIGFVPKEVAANIVGIDFLDSVKPELKRFWVSNNKEHVRVTFRIIGLKTRKSEFDKSYIEVLSDKELKELRSEARELRKTIKDFAYENKLKKLLNESHKSITLHDEGMLKKIKETLAEDKIKRAKINKLANRRI